MWDGPGVARSVMQIIKAGKAQGGWSVGYSSQYDAADMHNQCLIACCIAVAPEESRTPASS